MAASGASSPHELLRNAGTISRRGKGPGFRHSASQTRVKRAFGSIRATKPSPILPGVALEAGGLDAGERAGFVLVGGVAGNADGADDVARRVSDQHAAGI